MVRLTESNSKRGLVEKILPRVSKAALMGFIAFFIYYVLPVFLVSLLRAQNIPQEFDPYFARYEGLIYLFAAVMICFAVGIQLSSGTILKHALTMAKVIVLIIFFIYTLDGGRLVMAIPMEEVMIGVTADLSILLAILITIDLLGLAKSLFEAIDFLSQKAVLEPKGSQ